MQDRACSKALCKWEPRSQASQHGCVELCPIHHHPADESLWTSLCADRMCKQHRAWRPESGSYWFTAGQSDEFIWLPTIHSSYSSRVLMHPDVSILPSALDLSRLIGIKRKQTRVLPLYFLYESGKKCPSSLITKVSWLTKPHAFPSPPSWVELKVVNYMLFSASLLYWHG